MRLPHVFAGTDLGDHSELEAVYFHVIEDREPVVDGRIVGSYEEPRYRRIG